jgi:hypothetical protein
MYNNNRNRYYFNNNHRHRGLNYKSNIALVPSPQVIPPQRPQFIPMPFNPYRRRYLQQRHYVNTITRPVVAIPVIRRSTHGTHYINSKLTEGNKQLMIWIFCMFLICVSFWMTGEITI